MSTADPVSASLEPRTEPLSMVGMLYNLLDSMSEDVRPADLSLFIADLEAEIAAGAATEARRELLAKVEGLPLTTPDLAPRDYAGRRNVKEGPLRLYRAAVLRLIEESDRD